MSTKRDLIESLREKLRERNADSNYTNQFLYQSLIEHAKWLIKREISSGRIYRNTSFFQTLQCQDVIEVSKIDSCCSIETKCTTYRTKDKIPDAWIDNDGPIIKSVLSIDNSTSFQLISPSRWLSIKADPYQKKSKGLYTFFDGGYLWFPNVNPHKVNISGFWMDDVTNKNGCSEKIPCIKYLDTKFPIPDWLEAEMMSKTISLLAGISKKLPDDEQIDKNTINKR